MKHPDVKLIIFSKAPDAGKVKTRLIPALGTLGATQLHQRMSQHIIDRMQQTQLCDLELQCHPDSKHPFFVNLLNHYCIELNKQHGDDLGQRMSSAINAALVNYKYAIIIGTDAPAIDEAYIAGAIDHLKSGIDLVLGPAEDGGYVLIGLSKPAPGLFAGVDWGTQNVLKQSIEKARQAKLSIKQLDTRWDIDIADDLQQLSQNSGLAHLLNDLEIKHE